MYWEKNIKNHTIIYSEYKYDSKQYNIEMLLNSWEFNDFLETLKESYNIVIWWDGTMLYALKNYYKNNKKFIWINFWNKWFLLQDKKIILNKSNFIDKKYSIFDIFIHGEYFDSFINEISITASNGKMWSFEINFWEKETLRLDWDGFIIASPLWSTAYNSSLWWPILSHHSKSLVFTPKAAWKPKHLPSIVIPETEDIFIKNVWRFHWIELYSDGQWKKIEEKDIQIHIKKSESEIIFAIADNQENTWENKIFNFS
jgi:NAD kinase